MTSLHRAVDSISKKGRGGDSMVGHLTPGDIVIPAEIHTPEISKVLREHFSKHGADADQYVAGHKENSINPDTGIPEFGWFHKLFNPIRDLVETGASLAGNYLLPGSSIVTDKLVSKGSQKQLNSPLGQIAQIGTGLAGGGVGESVTGIPAASEIGAGWTNAANAVGGVAGDATLGTDISNGVSGMFNSVTGKIGDAAGLGTGASSSAAPAVPIPKDGFLGTAAAGAAPSSLETSSFLDDPNSILSSGSTPASVGSDLSSAASSNVGSGTVGTPSIGSANNAATGNFDLAGNMNTGTMSGGTGISKSLGSAAAEAAKPSSVSQFISDPSFKNAGNVLSSNAGTLFSAGGLGLDALKQQTPMKGTNQISQIADQERQQGAQLQSYLSGGTLPAGLQQSLNQATESAKATIRSKYASMGMSGSSAEQQELSQVDSRAQAQGAELAINLMNSGINETGMSAGLYQALLNANIEQDKDLGSAISSFASSAAGGGAKAA